MIVVKREEDTFAESTDGLTLYFRDVCNSQQVRQFRFYKRPEVLHLPDRDLAGLEGVGTQGSLRGLLGSHLVSPLLFRLRKIVK